MSTFNISTLPSDNFLGPFLSQDSVQTIGQVFVSPIGFPFLVSMTFELFSSIGPEPTLPVFVYLYKWNGSNPEGPILFKTSFTISGSDETQRFTFVTRNALLEPNITYIAFLSSIETQPQTRTISTGVSAPERYPQGQFRASGVTTFADLFKDPWGLVPFNMGFDFLFSSSKVPCLHPKTLVLSKGKYVPISDLRKGDKVTNMKGENVRIIHNMCFPQVDKFIRIKKDALGLNVPKNDLLIRSGHPIFIDGKEVNPEDLIKTNKGVHKIKVDSANVWSLCTKKRVFIMMEGVPVATWALSDVIDKNFKFVSY
jgi:hypothetical protein